MSLLLSSRAIGQGWEQHQPGDIAGILDQWYVPHGKAWVTLPLAVVGYPCRLSNLWRRPVTRGAKLSAIWAAKGKLFRRYILRKT